MGELPTDAVGQPIEVSLDQAGVGFEVNTWPVKAPR